QTQNERPLRLELTIHDIPLLVNFIRWGSLPPGFPISPAPTRGPASFDVCPFLRGPRRAASPGLPAAAPSLRMVAGGFPDMKRGCHAFIAQMERHPGGGMVQIVTVIHPDPGVVRPKRHLIGLPGGDVEGVRPPGAAGDRFPVSAH